MEKTSKSCTKIGGVTVESELIKAREARHLTQASVAEFLDVSTSTVSYWERGKKLSKMMTYAKLERLYGITLKDLFFDDNFLPDDEKTFLIKEKLRTIISDINEIIERL